MIPSTYLPSSKSPERVLMVFIFFIFYLMVAYMHACVCVCTCLPCLYLACVRDGVGSAAPPPPHLLPLSDVCMARGEHHVLRGGTGAVDVV